MYKTRGKTTWHIYQINKTQGVEAERRRKKHQMHGGSTQGVEIEEVNNKWRNNLIWKIHRNPRKLNPPNTVHFQTNKKHRKKKQNHQKIIWLQNKKRGENLQKRRHGQPSMRKQNLPKHIHPSSRTKPPSLETVQERKVGLRNAGDMDRKNVTNNTPKIQKTTIKLWPEDYLSL